MQVNLQPGKYIVAVSGGVDSVVLLDVLSQQSDVELIVAHVDHGIRPDSEQDAVLVRGLAEKYNLPFETISLQLGQNTAEATAREKRYAWLEAIQAKHNADAIVTAHHQNDVVETVLINIVRGTGWRGLASLRDTDRIRRPLLHVPKIDIVTYAIDHNIQWREDSTNDDVRYLRNYIRHGIMPRLNQEIIKKLIDLYDAQCTVRDEIETELTHILPIASDDGSLRRYWLIMSPDEAAHEVLRQKFGALTRQHLTHLLYFARCARPGSLLELNAGQTYQVTVSHLIFLER